MNTITYLCRLVIVALACIACSSSSGSGENGNDGAETTEDSGDAAISAEDAADSSDSYDSAGTGDTSMFDASPDVGSDATFVCTCEDGESCGACVERLGSCCLDDVTYMGEAQRLAESCERKDGCRACCHECAALDCEAIMALRMCPNLQ